MSKCLFCAAFEGIAPLFFFPWLYIHICLWVPPCFGKVLFWMEFPILLHGPCSLQQNCDIMWHLKCSPCLGSWELVIDFMTQILFMADYTWVWTVAICVHHAMNGAGEESLTQSLFLKEEQALRAVRHLLRRQCWNECQQCHFNNPLKSLKSIQCEFIAKLKIKEWSPCCMPAFLIPLLFCRGKFSLAPLLIRPRAWCV